MAPRDSVSRRSARVATSAKPRPRVAHGSAALQRGSSRSARTARFGGDGELAARIRERFPSDAASRRSLAHAVAASSEALGEILGAFLIEAGMSRRDVGSVFRKLANKASSRQLSLEPATPHVWRLVCDAVTRWWRDPTYLDDAGRPRELPEFGPSPSIESLLSGIVPARQHEIAKVELLRTVATARRGVWRFEEDHGYLRLDAPQSVDRLQMMMSGMLVTFLDNQTRLRDPLVTKNFDRTAHVVAFPVRFIPELRAKLSRRLQRELEDLDAWMTAVAAAHQNEPTVLVGVSMFMHTGHQRRCAQPRSASRVLKARKRHE